MKKRSFLIILITITLLSSILLSSILGVTKAEYFKKLSKALDFEAKPDLALQYYLYDAVVHADDTTTKNVNEAENYESETGVYKDAQNILQTIVVGEKDPKQNTAYWKYKDEKNAVHYPKYFFGDSIVYQIKIPVDEAGYYTLDFTVDFLFGGSQEPYQSDLNQYGYNSKGSHEIKNVEYHYNHPDNEYFDDSVFTQSYQWCMGCEVLNSNDGFTFGNNTPLNMANRVSKTNEKKTWENEKIYYADNGNHSVYQWKTLTPTRAETVKLSFKATDDDVTKGYVIWAWDFTGIKGQHNYRISIKGLDINKVMNLDGTTDYRSSVDPYFMFPQTSFTNNQVYLYSEGIKVEDDGIYYRGSNVPGKTEYSDGRGTFITEATENSLGLRAESLFRSITTDANNENAAFTNRADPNKANPVSLQIPVKNIRYDTTYKVTFDFSIARQGNKDVANIIMNNAGFDTLFEQMIGANKNTTNTSFGKNLYDYAAFEEIFPSMTADTQFRSYLYGISDLNAGIGISNENHKVNRNQIVYANKDWNNQKLTNGQEGDFSLTKYNYVTRYNMAQSTGFTEFPKYTTLDEDGTVNDPFCTVVKDTTVTDTNGEKLEMTATTCRNWYNAIQHVEQNGQQGINWITFYNTTFSFNIDSTKNTLGTDERGYIKDLYWIWQIDALEHAGWYNIRIDNVRIQEVVQYSSEIEKNGVKIADTQIGTTHIKYNGIDDVTSDNVFANYRGWNGTGQNCDARGYDTKNYYAVGNIYAPIIDARKFSVAPGGGNGAKDYKIELDGWAVCKGGINKYVYSADGGKTWHDMTFTGTNVMTDRNIKDNDGSTFTVNGWYYAEGGVEQRLNQQTVGYTGDTNRVTFDESDGANCNFDNFALCADLEPYKNQPDLDIIIAAVPDTNTNLRCEILRIINYHSSNHYVSQVKAITSDIESSEGKIEMTPDNKLLAITNGTSGDANEGQGWVVDPTTKEIRYKEGTWYSDYYPTSYRGVMAHINAISSPIRYDNIATMASDIPIKTTLKIKGYMLCGYGVYGYAYSVDGGKSWIDIKDAKATTYASTDCGANAVTDYEKLLYQWITHSDSVDGNYFAYNGHKGKFDTDDTALEIDLSAYEGQVVDLIVAAKPYATSGEEGKKSDIYLPITKIDNVAVYGNDGTFYTRLHRVVLDQCILKDDDNESAKNKWAPVSATYPGGSKLARTDKWSNFGINDYSYTIFEPNNVNAINARLYYTEAAEMQSGGRVTIDGYVVCKGGVRRYKYSLDGGKTWTVINDSGMDINDNSCAAKNITMISEALKSDNTFDLNEGDGKRGDYCCYYNYEEIGKNLNPYKDTRDDFYEHAIEFNLPALPAGAERNLLVVAESTKDKLIPVLHIKLKFKHANGVSQYGYQSSTNRGELSTLSAGWQSELNQSLTFAPSVNSMNRITIPVTQSGEHQLVFTHMLSGINITNGSKAEFFVLHDGGDYTYFSDVSRQLNSNAENVEHVYSVNYPDKGGLNRITANITVTDDDVKRGYIVLDANYTGITADRITVNLQLARDALTKKPSQTLIDTLFATKDKGYGNNVLMSTATKAGDHSFSYDPILNPPIRKGSMKYIPSGGTNLTDPYNGSYLSVSKTYFDVGEPIIVDYKTTGITANNVYVYITSAQICNSGKYGDLYIKQAQVTNNTAGTLEFTASTHNLGDNIYDNDNVKPWANNIAELNKLRKLPAGEYKIWLVNNGGSFDPYNMQRYGWNLVTEPISIKVIDPEAPDLSMTYWSDRTYPNQTDNTTALTLNKVVYEQGEDIPFRISGKYEHVWVTVLKSDDFKGYTVDNLSSVSGFESYLNKNETYARYAEWGSSAHANDLSGGVLKTVDGGVPLEPGQYKVVYLFGQCLQHAWQGKAFSSHSNQPQKIMAIIDITIVPKNTLQKYSASYVKNDGSVGNILLDGNEFENFENLEKLENLTRTVTTLNDSTFTVTTTPVKHNVTLKIPNDVNTSLKNNVAFNIQTLPGNYSFNEISDGKTDYNAPFYSANLGSGTAALKIPVTAEGTYDLSFGGYLNSPITHRGYNKNITTKWKAPDDIVHEIPLNYDGAYMSVPKAVYTAGEVIPVSYYSRGSVTAVSPIKETGNLPWIGLIEHTQTQEPDNFENLEDMTGNSPNGVWHKRSYVNANTEGVKYISTAGIPAGTYQIYFRDNSAKLIHDFDSNVKNIYWWEYDMVHPITITIVESNNVANAAAKVDYSFSNVINYSGGYTSGTAELSQRVFYQGDNINVDINVSDLNQTYRLVLCKADDMLDNFVAQKILDKVNSETQNGMYTIYTSNFTYITEEGKLTTKQREGGNEKIPPGKYTLYFINRGSIIGANGTGCIYAVMDITILPAPTTVPVRGSAQIQSLSKPNDEIIEITQTVKAPTEIANPFNYYNVSGTFTVTAEDIARGYVIFEYNITGLPTYSEFTFAIDNWTVTKKQT